MWGVRMIRPAIWNGFPSVLGSMRLHVVRVLPCPICFLFRAPSRQSTVWVRGLPRPPGTGRWLDALHQAADSRRQCCHSKADCMRRMQKRSADRCQCRCCAAHLGPPHSPLRSGFFRSCLRLYHPVWRDVVTLNSDGQIKGIRTSPCFRISESASKAGAIQVWIKDQDGDGFWQRGSTAVPTSNIPAISCNAPAGALGPGCHLCLWRHPQELE
jgi:hypothetical protein